MTNSTFIWIQFQGQHKHSQETLFLTMENLPALNFQLDLLSVELSEKTITENFPGQNQWWWNLSKWASCIAMKSPSDLGHSADSKGVI